MRRLMILSICLAFTEAAFAQEAPAPTAQQPPTPEQMHKIMDATLSAMIPYMGKMVESMLLADLETMARPESATQMAQYVRNFYLALIKEGFTKTEAFEIASKVPIPAVSASGK